MTTADEGRKVFFGPGRVRITGSRVRGIVASPPPVHAPGGQGRGSGGGQGKGQGGQGKGRGGGNSLAALAQALGAVSATGGKVVPSPSVGTTWYSGIGAPAATLGTLNDWYFNESNRDVYTNASALVTPSFGAAAWSAVATSSTPSISMPSAITAGDLLVMVVSAVDSAIATAPTVTTPSGWTRFINRDLFESGSHGVVYAYWKIAVGSDPSVTLAIDRNSSTHASVTRYSGGNPTTPVNVVAAGTVASGGTTLTTAAIATTAGGCLVVSYGIVVENPTLPWTAPSGITVRAGDNTTTGRINGHEFGDLAAGGAGVYGPYVWTNTGNGAQPHYGVTFALQPADASKSWTRVGALAA